MQQEALLTCAFSTYNASETIEFAIESAFNQTYKNKEYLIIDDCSNDNTLKIISEINKKKNNVIHIVKNDKNRGIGEVRNQLIKLSNGVFIAFFDHDDYSHPDRVKEQIKSIQRFEKKHNIQSENSPLCYTNRKIIFSPKNFLICKSVSYDVNKYSNTDGALALLSAKRMPKFNLSGSTATCTLCARKKSLVFIGGFNNELRRYEDLDLAINALLKKTSLISVDEILLDQFFKNEAYKKNSEIYELKMIKLHKKFLEENNLFDFSYNFAKMKHYFINYNLFYFFKYLLYLQYKYPINFITKVMGSFKTFFFSFLNKLYSNANNKNVLE
ncbi:possible glycosyl transferase [Prochlorococcus marinus subsp. pastoris str. CCMP1986]|uniref:Possible glycosyl transferase n=1 Tax=Prochlorococcus marinus subsp. pastoris (strain CCMP1986 / NIES-2087 / MED4) TaxID=59919 RepID=Q7V0N4_PROMP|nr:glycosyltransferase [Prochlorococcus marinus]KGF87217.1 Glycosyltransferase [Prochlorococcus marinus str. EQPAC1]CAE19681.1 possible glycosyl transferase [Prochlorococcus marinus subsp. pastoris str. CCMP1986]